MTRSERVYRGLLRAYPKHTRDALGDDMVQLFNDRLRDASTPRGVAAAWADVLVDLAGTAPRERLRRRALWQLVDGPAEDEPRVPMKRDVAFALLPVCLCLALAVWHPGYYDSFFVNPPGFLGMGLGAAVLLLFGLLASGGLLAVRRNRELRDPWHQAVAMMVLAVPVPTIAIMSGPVQAIAYGIAATLLVLIAQFKHVMLALVAPLVVWLVAGPVILAPVLDLLNGIGAASP